MRKMCKYCKFNENCSQDFKNCDTNKLYSTIAEEQQKLDVDKACEWLRNYIISSEWNEFAEIHFRKAMMKEE